MNFVYCIGGTGARIAEVAAHLCAMNMVDNQTITFIVVDKDSTCGGTEQAKSTIRLVTSLSDVSDDSSQTALKRSAGKSKEFCKCTLLVPNEADTWDFTKAFANISEIKTGNGNGPLKGTLSKPRSSDPILFNAFYNKEEQEQDTEGGFYGKPSIGALIFKQMVKKGGWEGNALEKDDIAYPVKKYLGQHKDAEVRVFIVGSIFGGTGAAVFSNLARHIRSTTNAGKNLLISGVLLLPYFGIAPAQKAEDQKIKEEKFYDRSRVALQQYAADPNLMCKVTNGGGSFDTLYVCGQEPLHQTGEGYADSGKGQNNHFDLVDVVAARAMTEFFKAPAADVSQKGEIFTFRFTGAGETVPAAELAMLGDEMRRSMTAMLVFSAFVLTKVFGAYLLHKDDPHKVAMFNSLYRSGVLGGELYNAAHQPKRFYTQEVQPTAENFLRNIYKYCTSYLGFIYDVARNGHNWAQDVVQGSDYESQYRFFNKNYIEQLLQIIKAIENQNPNKVLLELIQRFLTSSQVYAPGDTAGVKVQEIEEALDDLFDKINRQYSAGTAIQERFGDYIHEAFKYCLMHC